MGRGLRRIPAGQDDSQYAPWAEVGRERRQAAADRALSAADRLRAAADRSIASTERALAARDRARAARDRELAESDDLTGVLRRGPGARQLAKEIDRARRASQSLVLAFIDVDGLKRVNDRQGHLAGDALLLSVADALRTRLRSYDLIVRFGGDEFICVLPDSDVQSVRQRFAEAAQALCSSPTGGSISVGYAQLRDGDSTEKLIARADADLLGQRRAR
jgi:diguanylate cyclase (GGDEF)-like protein